MPPDASPKSVPRGFTMAGTLPAGTHCFSGRVSVLRKAKPPPQTMVKSTLPISVLISAQPRGSFSWMWSVKSAAYWGCGSFRWFSTSFESGNKEVVPTSWENMSQRLHSLFSYSMEWGFQSRSSPSVRPSHWVCSHHFANLFEEVLQTALHCASSIRQVPVSPNWLDHIFLFEIMYIYCIYTCIYIYIYIYIYVYIYMCIYIYIYYIYNIILYVYIIYICIYNIYIYMYIYIVNIVVSEPSCMLLTGSARSSTPRCRFPWLANLADSQVPQLARAKKNLQPPMGVRPWHHAGPAASSSVSITPTPNLVKVDSEQSLLHEIVMCCDIVQMKDSKDQKKKALHRDLSDLAQWVDGEPMESWKESVQMAMAAMGVPWCTMVYHGVPWCTMVYHGVPWCTMVYHGVPWCTSVPQSSHQNIWSSDPLNPSPVQLKSLIF